MDGSFSSQFIDAWKNSRLASKITFRMTLGDTRGGSFDWSTDGGSSWITESNAQFADCVDADGTTATGLTIGFICFGHQYGGVFVDDVMVTDVSGSVLFSDDFEAGLETVNKWNVYYGTEPGGYISVVETTREVFDSDVVPYSAGSTVTFNELMYHPLVHEVTLEWLELYNQMSYDVDISDWSIRGGIDYAFPEGTFVPAWGYAVVAISPSGLQAESGYADALGPFEGRLANNGEEIRLINNSGRVMDVVEYSDGGRWPVAPDGSGVSLVKRDPDSASDDPENWTWSARSGGTPGQLNRLHESNGLAFNEVTSAATASFWIELYNSGDQSIDLTSYVLACRGGVTGEYALPGASLGPGEYLALEESTLGFHPQDEDKLFLYAPESANTVMDAVVVKNSHRGRHPDGTGEWLYPDRGTLGATNSFALQDAIVINEIMYHHQPQYEPYEESPEEWIELYNRSGSAVDVSGWRFTDGIAYTFPPGTSIAPDDYLVVAKDAVALAWKYPSIEIVGDFEGSLSNRGERILLVDANRNPVDEVRYYDDQPWPEYADGGGSSLELRDPDADNAVPEAWAASSEGGKSTWETFTYTKTAAPTVPISDPDGVWEEYLLCLLEAGEVLLDDLSVLENGSVEFLQNGTFESDMVGAAPDKWRVVGNHQQSSVITDPAVPANKVLHLVATGPGENTNNHLETTFGNSESVENGRQYTISLRAKWIAGSPRINCRLYHSRCQATLLLDVPQDNGTPGAVNSRTSGNIGPTHRDLKHRPVVPSNTEAVTVSVVAEDPDGISSCTLWSAVDEGAWSSLLMAPQGNGLYTGPISQKPTASIVQFYVEATDALGATSTCPAAGHYSRALYKVDDGAAATHGLHNLRIIMKPSDAEILHSEITAMNNNLLGATVIYDERTAYYDVGVRLKGSPHGRADSQILGYRVQFHDDQLLCGVHRSVNIDRGNSDQSYPRQRELIDDLAMCRAGGTVSKYNNLVQLLAPDPSYNESAMLQLARFEPEFLGNQFRDGNDGKIFEMEDFYWPLSTDDGTPEGNKRHGYEPRGCTGEGFHDYGDEKEIYRMKLLIKNHRAADDYERIIEFCRAWDWSCSDIAGIIDMDQYLRSFAYGTINGAGDQYSTGESHNAFFYVRHTDQRVLYFPHDMDNTWIFNRPLVGNNNLWKLLADGPAANRRLYYGHLLDMINTAYNADYMERFTDQFGALLPHEDYASILAFIGDRSAFLLGEIQGEVAPQYPFEVTTTGGTTSATLVAIDGRGWINVYRIYIEGRPDPLELTWTSTGSGTSTQFYWQAMVPLAFGTNALVFNAYNFQGELVGTDSVTFECTSTEALREYLRVTEVMYNPVGGSDYEFIELQNTGPAPLDLSNVVITDGISFLFAAGSVPSLAAGDYVVVVNDLAAFSSRYNTAGLNIAGEYAGNLANEGESIRILGEYNAEVVSFEYDDKRGWPLAADGAGHSLVPLSSAVAGQPGGSLDYGGNWRICATIGGSPGEADPEPPVVVLLSEIMANTVYSVPPHDSNDWIELYNPGQVAVTLNSGQWFLSDDVDELEKWALPQTVLQPSAWVAFDEVTGFHNPIDEGFGLSKAGEQVLLSYLPGTGSDRVVDCIRFEGQEPEISLGRFEDGQQWWYKMVPSRSTENLSPIPHVVIEELMYHPETESDSDEYIELYNPTDEPVALWTSAGPWRVAGGVDYEFPTNTTLPAKECLLIVHFDPTNPTALDAFKSSYGLSDIDAQIVGPFAGSLSNRGERLGLEKLSDSLDWVIVDEVIYFDQAPFPAEPDGGGKALQRIRSWYSGNAPTNWESSDPSPGETDLDVIMWTLY